MEFLYGELPAHEQRECRRHLDTCPVCQSQVQAWRSTQALLDADRGSLAPRATAPRSAILHPFLQWAAAAAFILGVGFVAGRSGSPTRDDLKAEIARAQDQLRTELQGRYADDLKSIATAAVAGSTAENQRFLNEFVTRFTTARTDERRDFLKALQGLEDCHAVDYAELRTGLSQLARTTGSGFRQAESQINLIAAQLPPEPASTDSSLPTTPIQSK